MKKITLCGSEMADMAAVHRFFAKELDFPEWYGNNLDALHDCLTDIREETVIEITEKEALSEAVGVRYRRFIKALSHAAEENDYLTLNL